MSSSDNSDNSDRSDRSREVGSVWAEDESRFGLKSWHRRIWMALRHRPDWVSQQKYEWLYIYGAIDPLTGRSLFLLLPDQTKESMGVFIEEFRQVTGGEEVLLFWDGSGSHQSWEGKMPEGIKVVRFPKYSPELNPVEQVWRELRKRLANRIFETLEDL